MTGTKHHAMIVQPRDLEFLRLLAMLGVVDRDIYMMVAGFHSITRANTRLLKLYQAGLLRRFFLGSGGGRKALYALSPKGALLAGVPYRGPRRRQGELLIGDFYVQHQLTVNAVYCALARKPIPVPGVTFLRWLPFYEPIAPNLKLIPDGYVELAVPTGKLCVFVEVDLGHENLSIWREKARQYLQLALTGEFERRFHEDRFRVLVLVNSDRRLNSIRKAVTAVTEKIFWFATLEATSSNFFASVWLRPVGDRPKPLIEN
jgi:hypothetical protein